MLDVKDRTIDGVTYKVAQLPWRDARKLLVRLYQILGPAVGQGLAGLDARNEGDDGKPKGLGDLPLKSIGDMVTALTTRCTEADFEFITDMAVSCTVLVKDERREVPLSTEIVFHFAGAYGRMLKWLAFVLEVNYLGFSQGRGNLSTFLAQAAEKAKAYRSQNTSIGGSTGLHRPTDTTSAQ